MDEAPERGRTDWIPWILSVFVSSLYWYAYFGCRNAGLISFLLAMAASLVVFYGSEAATVGNIQLWPVRRLSGRDVYKYGGLFVFGGMVSLCSGFGLQFV